MYPNQSIAGFLDWIPIRYPDLDAELCQDMGSIVVVHSNMDDGNVSL